MRCLHRDITRQFDLELDEMACFVESIYLHRHVFRERGPIRIYGVLKIRFSGSPPRSNIIVYPLLEGAAQMKANSPGSGHLFNDSTLPLGSVDQDLGLS